MKTSNSPLTGAGRSHAQKGLQDISVIRFEGHSVRIISINGEPWFIAADVCKALEIENSTKAVKPLDGDEVMTLTLIQGHSGKRGGARSWNAASESGFYKLIARSRKASKPGTFAHRFTNWIFRDVIPSIRKTGGYGVPFGILNDYSRRMAAFNVKASQRGRDLQACKQERESLESEEVTLWATYQPFLPEIQS
ncbi:antirepressor protein [Lelliottia amnigena]|uniref:BRO-N domain-containing protein n=1 Tax=Lelliottia amnigena TaxID=61646 RepID=UPI00192B52FF|nr:BRO family protein [Lelliottia amnigena]MBL5922021.1 antirepressor protein [Lelliottia amnigena]